MLDAISHRQQLCGAFLPAECEQSLTRGTPWQKPMGEGKLGPGQLRIFIPPSIQRPGGGVSGAGCTGGPNYQRASDPGQF